MHDDHERSAIPTGVGKAAGLFAGAAVGWQAGEVIGHSVASQLPTAISAHDGLVADAMGIAGAFGCAVAGYTVATRKPAEGLLVAAATIATGKVADNLMGHEASAPTVDPLAASHDVAYDSEHHHGAGHDNTCDVAVDPSLHSHLSLFGRG